MIPLKTTLTLSLLLLGFILNAQSVRVEGTVSETDNRGVLRNTDVMFLRKSSNELFAKTKTDKSGKFSVDLPSGMDFQLVASKNHFFSKEQFLSTKTLKKGSHLLVEVEMERKPGYIFEVMITESDTSKIATRLDVIKGARIEVFNNTTGKQELDLRDYPFHHFKFNFEKGNHYTLMIRKKGYLNKRIEAYIDIEDCILCFDGLGIIDPGVTDVLSNNNTIGTFLANIELEPARLNKTFAIENIYYDYDDHSIREDAAAELQKLFEVLNDNPGIIIEMGSHTDSRGSDNYNLQLSDKRAEAAVEYLVNYGNVDPGRLTWKGYGESALINKCENGVPCPEEYHQFNRRTELKIVGFQDQDPIAERSLEDILVQERLTRKDDESGNERIEASNNSKKASNDNK